MNYLQDIVTQIEIHSVDGIKNCFENGISPNQIYKDRPLIEELISEYTRTSRFKDCVKTFVDYGLQFDDKALLAVLLDDSSTLEKLITENPETVSRKYTLKCAHTPLDNASLLHICAEFNHLSCAEILVKHNAEPMLDLFLSKKVDLKITVKGIIWGKGYKWETLLPSVNPISYAMMGLLPQMHRDETVVHETVLNLIQHRYNVAYPIKNVPNKYLNS